MAIVKKMMCIGALAIFTPLSSFATEVTETYQYDPLGRLRVVETDGNSKIEYCYDKAGNRKAVGGSGTSADCPTGNEPPPPPTGLTKVTHWGGVWLARWESSPGATRYELRFGPASYYSNVSGSATEQAHSDLSEPPVWIKACSDNGCSSRAYF